MKVPLEDAIRMVQCAKDAAIGMGHEHASGWMVKVADRHSGILTGVMLAVARAAGDGAAPVHGAVQQLLALVARAREPQTGRRLVLIYNFASMPFQNQVELAWAAALVLVLLVLAANLTGQMLSSARTHQS
jgi:phosphate transport system permease protein